MKSILETLVKIAYDLDQQEKYSEADKIEEAIRILQQRVGLDVVSDMVSLADDLDQTGDTKNAEQLDLVIQKLSEIQKQQYVLNVGMTNIMGELFVMTADIHM